MIGKMGLKPYERSFSVRNSSEGEHRVYSARDTKFEPAEDYITDKHAQVLIDYDYYVDMNEILSWFVPTFLYTFSPVMPSGHTAECSWSITADGHVDFSVAGGGHYNHEIWDYSNDFIQCSKWGFNYAYCVSSIQYSPTHKLVYLQPVAVLWSAPYLDPFLSRVKSNLISNGEMISGTCPRGMKFTVPTQLFAAVQYRYATAARRPPISDIEAILRVSKMKDPYLTATALDSLFSNGEVRPHHAAFTAYVADAQGLLPHAENPACTTLCDPVALGGAVGDSNDSYAAAAEIYRHVKVKNTTIPPVEYAALARDFVAFLKLQPFTPISIQEVKELQKKATQIERNKRAAELPGEWCRVKAFTKREGQTKVSAMRNISNVNVRFQLELSTYTVAFKRVNLKHLSFYMPCSTPQEVEQSVRKVCMEKDTVIETDYSKYDGTISEWLRTNVEFACYLSVCPSEYKNHFRKLLRSELDCPARTKAGTYEVQGSRLSGSPLTTDGNTLLNAFVNYCVVRKLGENPENGIGICFGDDGLFPGMPGASDAFVEVTSALGLTLKAEEKSFDVGFLGRIFPNPWGNADNFQDPRRWMRKAHFSASNNPEALYLKACGYYTTDPKTPLLSQWCRRIFSILGKEPKYHARNHYLDSVGGSWSVLSCVDAAIASTRRLLGIGHSEFMDALEDISAGGTTNMPSGSEPTEPFRQGSGLIPVQVIDHSGNSVEDNSTVAPSPLPAPIDFRSAFTLPPPLSSAPPAPCYAKEQKTVCPGPTVRIPTTKRPRVAKAAPKASQ